MKIKYLLVLLLSSTLVFVTGCSHQLYLYDMPTQSIVTNKKQASEDDIKKAIITAGASRGWVMHVNSPGHISATLNIRVHMAMVTIDYDTESYSIKYLDSTNLKYQPAGTDTTDEDGMSTISTQAVIHKAYNLWISELDRSIKAQLSTIY